MTVFRLYPLDFAVDDQVASNVSSEIEQKPNVVRQTEAKFFVPFSAGCTLIQCELQLITNVRDVLRAFDRQLPRNAGWGTRRERRASKQKQKEKVIHER